jgi:hypothetical protein
MYCCRTLLVTHVVKVHVFRAYTWIWDEIKTLTGTCPSRHSKSRTRDGGRRRALGCFDKPKQRQFLVTRDSRKTSTVSTNFKFKRTRSTESSASPLGGFAAACRAHVSARVTRQHPRLLPPPHLHLHETSGLLGVVRITHDARREGSGVIARGGGLSTPAIDLASLFTFQLQVASTAWNAHDCVPNSQACRASQN